MKNKTLKAIKDSNLIFISAQPDVPYFHWQVELYMYQFSKHNIINRCYSVFGYEDKPSERAQKIAKKFSNIFFYKDTRKDKSYQPTIRPHLLAKFFKDTPHLGKNVFVHDSDILLVKLPKFELMLNDKIAYMSDTVSYIGYKYIKDCSKRYKDTYPKLPKDDIFIKMCETLNMDAKLVKSYDKVSGGAQYLFKDIDHKFWDDCEHACNKLYTLLCDYEKKYPIDHHIQKWTAEMWAVLWIYWKYGKETKIHPELDFSWATDPVSNYFSKKIFHLAGVTTKTSHDKFHKGKYVINNVFDEYKKDKTIFDHIDSNNATYEYVKLIKKYFDKNYKPLIKKHTKKSSKCSKIICLFIFLIIILTIYKLKSHNF